MTDPMTDTTPTTRRTPRPRGEGQWGLGYHEPLNTAEQIKKESEPLHVRERIERVFAPGGFRSIGKQDLRSRMRWWGLYTQRKQSVPGERTGSAEPEELEDEFFMMRIRIDGGRMTPDQLRAIAWASERYGRDVADITDRQNVQLHWIRIEDVPAIFERLESTGLTTAEACGDTPRVILGCPLAGVMADEALDGTPEIRAIHERYIGSTEFSNLPRKYKTSISGCPRPLHEPRAERHRVRRRRASRARSRLRPVGRRRPVDEPDVRGQRLGAFVQPANGHRRVGRRHGAVPRVRLPPVSQPRAFEVPREGLGRGEGARGAGNGVPRRAASPTGRHPHRPRCRAATTSACIRRVTDASRSGSRPRAGRIAGHQLRLVADLAEAYGDGRVAATAQQKLVILGVAPERADELVARLEELDLRARPDAFRKGMMACTGIEFCKLAIGETKGRAVWLTEELAARLPDFDEEIRIHVNGCPNSCARFQVADIGLMSALQTRPDGTRSDAFLIHLGGTMGDDAAFGRKVKGVKVYAEDTADYVEDLLRRYRNRRAPDDTFSTFVNRLDADGLARFAAQSAKGAELR